MSLAAQQAEFMAHILDEERPATPGWDARFGAGLEIYRNAYRTRLVDALRETYERTAQWVGEESFAAAAAHHVITRPPNSWTLDHAGDGFAEVLAELFAHDPEVAELAWMEWAMHGAFVAADPVPLDREGFLAATAGFAPDDWAAMRLAISPALAMREVAHDVPALWQALARGEDTPHHALDRPHTLLVWREGFTPVFRLADCADAAALAAMQRGEHYGAACAALADSMGEDAAAARAGALLGQWLADGLVTAVNP